MINWSGAASAIAYTTPARPIDVMACICDAFINCVLAIPVGLKSAKYPFCFGGERGEKDKGDVKL